MRTEYKETKKEAIKKDVMPGVKILASGLYSSLPADDYIRYVLAKFPSIASPYVIWLWNEDSGFSSGIYLENFKRAEKIFKKHVKEGEWAVWS